MDDHAIAQRSVAAAAAAVQEEIRNVAEALHELKDWKVNNPGYTVKEPDFKTRQAAVKEARVALKEREVALKEREAALKEGGAALNEREAALNEREAALNEARSYRLRLASTGEGVTTIKSQRGLNSTLSLLTNLEGAPFADVDSTEPASKKPRIGVHLVSDLTAKFEAFRTAELVDGCIVSLSHTLLPYSLDKVEKLFVRKCYEDVFALLMDKIKIGVRECFGISGTPGVGKSLFVIYILYRLLKDRPVDAAFPVVATPSASTSAASSSLPASSSRSFKPTRVLYHAGSCYLCYDLETFSVVRKSKLDAEEIVRKPGTFYIIDGRDSQPAPSACATLFIASPRSDSYKQFVKQRKAYQWYFPTWALDELESCRNGCYLKLPISTLLERYRIYGGVARPIFYPDDPKAYDYMEAALADVDAVKGVRNIGNPTQIYQTSHTLLHIITTDDGQYQFKCVDIASDYVGEKLWEKHSAQMITNLVDMFGSGPNEISRHLFEIYGHRVFSFGGRSLECRSLETGKSLKNLTLKRLGGKRVAFGRDSIPKKPIRQYHEPSDDDNFPAIDSLSPQGMFQFTVGAVHPIRGVSVLQKVCSSFDKPKLYFVVPPICFPKFGKQKFLATAGQDAVNSIAGLKQYVLQLPVE
ncbi:hypothetical protein CcCBS67573_g09749 [Chytriomyces confervae]|uniref:Uncharacterized protein n=1 Tax=Chytriomyces confervae TaxID=246404 RepID=A0A507DQE4_9FUNG|nr:hypothetical protein CcCBS67573_g09749 [Chytriomyces confervae]